MYLDLIDLRLFLAIHDAGTITGGAARVHMTLASASERVRTLEARIGVPLLRREARGVRPTPAGHTLLQHARMVLTQVDRLQGELDEHASGAKGHIRMLCNTAALAEYLPDALGRFLAAQPGISVDLEERPSEQIVQALRDGWCDLGIASDAVDLAGLDTRVLRSDSLVLVVPRGDPLADTRRVAFADVLGRRFVGLDDGSALSSHLAAHARRAGARIDHRVRVRSFEAVCRLVAAGVGVAIVPRTVARRGARGGQLRLVALDDAWAARRLVLCARSFDDQARHVARLVTHLTAGA